MIQSYIVKKRYFKILRKFSIQNLKEHLIHKLIYQWKQNKTKFFIKRIYREWQKIILNNCYKKNIIKNLLIQIELKVKQRFFNKIRKIKTNYCLYKMYENKMELKLSKENALNEEIKKEKLLQENLAVELYDVKNELSVIKEKLALARKDECNYKNKSKEIDKEVQQFKKQLDERQSEILKENNNVKNEIQRKISENKNIKELTNYIKDQSNQLTLPEINENFITFNPNMGLTQRMTSWNQSDLGLKAKNDIKNKLRQLKGNATIRYNNLS